MDRVLGLIGLATKAGKTASGEFAVEEAVKKGKARLVIVAEDASDNTKKGCKDMCAYYDIPMYIYGNKETLGSFCGKQMRASAAIIDEGFGKSIEKLIKNNQN